MKLKILFSMLILLIGMVAFSLVDFSPKDESFISLKDVKAAPDIHCACAFWGGNANCLANNAGSTCAPAGSLHCQSFNSNCGGTDVPIEPTNP